MSSGARQESCGHDAELPVWAGDSLIAHLNAALSTILLAAEWLHVSKQFGLYLADRLLKQC